MQHAARPLINRHFGRTLGTAGHLGIALGISGHSGVIGHFGIACPGRRQLG